MNPRNYQKELDRILKDLKRTDRVPHLLLHSCCGPCSSYVLEYLAPFFKITVFYDNPNIQPRAEYEHRLAEQRRVIAHIQAPHGIALVEGDYDPRRYADAVRGLTHLGEGSARCFACYRFRMQAAAELARDLGCDYFTTTLSISPYKNAERINAIPKLSVLYPPKGSFYLFVNIKGTGLNSVDAADMILRKAHVLTLPGNAFGACGEGYIRIACTCNVETLKEAFDRIERALQ